MKKTPNCKTCEWAERTVMSAFSNNVYCGAQGGIDASSIYNNKLCRKLYQENPHQYEIKVDAEKMKSMLEQSINDY